MAQERPVFDNEATARLPFCIPFPRPVPIPTEAWNEEPTRCIRINAHWCSYILGALECLDQPDTWIGTDNEIFDARQQVREIMLAVMGQYECEEAMPAEYIKSIDACDNGALKWTRVLNGVEQEIQMDLASCIVPSLYVRTITTCNDGEIEFEEVSGDVVNTRTIDVQNCLDLPTAMLTGLVCDETGFAYKAWTRVTGEQTISFDLEDCIDIPPAPVPYLVGDDLIFDTDADGLPDLNVGNVRGLPGQDGQTGAAGADAPIPGVFISNGDLYFDANGDDVYANLGKVVGDDGECPPDCTQIIVSPPVIPGQSDDQTRCNISGYIANIVLRDGLQEIIDSYTATGQFVNAATGILASLVGAATGGFLAPIVVAAVGTLAGRVLSALNSAEELVDDETFFSAAACEINCAIAPDAGITEENFPALVLAIRTLSHPGADWGTFLGDYVEALGAAVVSQAITIGSIIAYDCTNCDCEDEPGACSGSHSIGVGATNNNAYSTNFVLPVGCCYTIQWAGEVRVGGTAGAPLMGDGNRQQVSAGNWGAGGSASGDILQWNTGTGWVRIPTNTPYNAAGYSVTVPSTGVALQLRWFAAQYGNNSGTMTVNVTGSEC